MAVNFEVNSKGNTNMLFGKKIKDKFKLSSLEKNSVMSMWKDMKYMNV